MEYVLLSIIFLGVGFLLSFIFIHKINTDKDADKNIEHLFDLQRKDWEKGQSDFRGLVEPLKENLKELQSKEYNTKFIIEENKRLRTLIDEYIGNSEELIGKVLLDKNSPFLKSIIINKGSKDNVEIGMAVLDKEYLVGNQSYQAQEKTMDIYNILKRDLA